MPEKNRTFEANIQSDRPLKLQPRPKPEERAESENAAQAAHHPIPRRAVVVRLIEWFKQD